RASLLFPYTTLFRSTRYLARLRSGVELVVELVARLEVDRLDAGTLGGLSLAAAQRVVVAIWQVGVLVGFAQALFDQRAPVPRRQGPGGGLLDRVRLAQFAHGVLGPAAHRLAGRGDGAGLGALQLDAEREAHRDGHRAGVVVA